MIKDPKGPVVFARGKSLDELQEDINKKIREGYRMRGEMHIFSIDGIFNSKEFCQQMIYEGSKA